MGVIYKIKPEIKDYALEQKKTTPSLSCRNLTVLIEQKFQIKVSKSSINSLFKEAGLSMPVGRRQKKRRKLILPLAPLPQPEEPKLEIKPEVKIEIPVEKTPEIPIVESPKEAPVVEPPKEIPIVEPPKEIPVEPQPVIPVQAESPTEIEATGAILLKAADYLIGGSYHFYEAVKSRLARQENGLLAKTENLIFMPLEQELGVDLSTYLNELQGVKEISSDLSRLLANVNQEVRCLKAGLSDGTVFYLDGQLHTVWSAPQIPYDFSVTSYNIRSYINKSFRLDNPLILLMAPGYDLPSPEFFNFMLGLEGKSKGISYLVLYGNKFEELETIRLGQAKKRAFIFGLWPWQYVDFRKVKRIGEFKPFHFAPLNKDFFIADTEIDLIQPNIIQPVTLKGCALKATPNDKTRLLILSNLDLQATTPEWLANTYLSRWPNLEEGFQDFSRKVELFTYTASSQRFFSTEAMGLSRDSASGIKALLNSYLKALDLYVKWHFLPVGYEDKDFPTVKEHFYSLKARLKEGKEHILATFQPPEGYRFLPDLQYACCRINEREIAFSDKRRLWLAI